MLPNPMNSMLTLSALLYSVRRGSESEHTARIRDNGG